MIVSTPNRLFSEQLPGPPNPFHVREFDASELKSLLCTRFSEVDVRGQFVHPRFPVCPYWQLPSQLPTDPRGRLRVLNWKFANRLPFRVKDGWSRLVRNRAFFPGEFDWVFSTENVGDAHVLIAVCKK